MNDDQNEIINQNIYTNSNMLVSLINSIIELSSHKKKNHKCEYCNKEFTNEYFYSYKNYKFKFNEVVLHKLKFHNLIDSILYKKICGIDESKIKTNIEWCLLNTNGSNIIDGLYEIGSNQIYTEKKKNISESKIMRFSEHSGFIYFEKKKLKTISVTTGTRVEQSDPIIYMPTNCAESLKVDYIFHTHPKTPYIGSRIKHGIIYEFPSVSDIIHFVEHHNQGKLLGSIIIAPEGIYVIRKNIFNRNPIKADYELMVENLENIFMECYNDSYLQYSVINYDELKINGEVKIPDGFFYSHISKNYEYINRINNVLKKYDLFIDYYARTHFNVQDTNESRWIFDDIYLPIVK